MIIDKKILQLAYEESATSGKSFSALEHIYSHNPTVDFDAVENEYIDKARKLTDHLVEPGAKDFIDFLKSTNRDFCIMSYGEKRWQNLKIMASGFGNNQRLVVPSSQKSLYISQWADSNGGPFIIPKEFFSDTKPRMAREVVLIDDKLAAFDGLPINSRGYLVQQATSKDTSINLNYKLSLSVKCVSSLDEIIHKETTNEV
jgi:hypothetical protein